MPSVLLELGITEILGPLQVLTTLCSVLPLIPLLHLGLSPEKSGNLAKDLQGQTWNSHPGSLFQSLCHMGWKDG